MRHRLLGSLVKGIEDAGKHSNITERRKCSFWSKEAEKYAHYSISKHVFFSVINRLLQEETLVQETTISS